jgi:hypothetical protein
MFIELDGKLYVQTSEDTIVGVNLGFSHSTLVDGTERKIEGAHSILTPFEAKARYGISETNEYKFPVLKVEVKEEVKTTKAKK